MKIYATGIGLWCEIAHNWQQFKNIYSGQDIALAPDRIDLSEMPPAERRRCPKTGKVAFEAAMQACLMAKVAPSTVASVFTSIMADGEVTDAICSSLASEEKLLSPTKFHNSVQNAPAGYWAISHENHLPCNFVGGHLNSWAVALLDAAAQCASQQRDILLVCYDIQNSSPLNDICNIEEDFACAILLTSSQDNGNAIELDLDIQAGTVDSPKSKNAELDRVIDATPAATAAIQLEAFLEQSPSVTEWPLGTGTFLRVTSTRTL